MGTHLCVVAALAVMLLAMRAAMAADLPMTGNGDEGTKSMDKFMQDFMEREQATGASVAITRNGRLVYARGFGWADREGKKAVEPTSLFRLASVSKPLTAVAVMQLAEQGKLDLEKTHPFTELGLPVVATPGQTADPRLGKINVLELLHHRAGFDRVISGDPMFKSVEYAKLCGIEPPAMQKDVIRVVEGLPLDYEPGERYAYSNLGYNVLGREIERVTGQTYEAYMQEHVLKPLGITDMRIGRTMKKDAAPGEVTYYTAHKEMAPSVFPPVGAEVPQQYGGWCLEAMDSHGAWIASAADVVKFASEFDDPKTCRLLKGKSVEEMFARPPEQAGQKAEGKPSPSWYGCGWSVRSIEGKGLNTWHTGLLAGTSTLMVRRWDGMDWAILFNQNGNEVGKNFSDLVDGAMHKAVNDVKNWPKGKGREEKWP